MSCAAKKDLRCNFHVIDLMKEKNIYLPASNANDIDIYLKSSSEWERIPKIDNDKLNHKSAYAAAKSGRIVLAVYNTGTQKNGHIVMVAGDKTMAWSGGYNAYVPYASGSVQGRKPEVLPLSYQFSADKEPKINYFIYNQK